MEGNGNVKDENFIETNSVYIQRSLEKCINENDINVLGKCTK